MPMDAVQLLLMRRVDHALLAEPAVVLRKAHSSPVSLVAPELHRSVDLQAQWGCTDRPLAIQRLIEMDIDAVEQTVHTPCVLGT